MSAVIIKTVNVVFQFCQPDVMKQIVQKKSVYDTDEVNKLLNLISADNIETILIPEEPVYFDYIALDLIEHRNPGPQGQVTEKGFAVKLLPFELLKTMFCPPTVELATFYGVG